MFRQQCWSSYSTPLRFCLECRTLCTRSVRLVSPLHKGLVICLIEFSNLPSHQLTSWARWRFEDDAGRTRLISPPLRCVSHSRCLPLFLVAIALYPVSSSLETNMPESYWRPTRSLPMYRNIIGFISGNHPPA